MSYDLSSIDILDINRGNYCCIISRINKFEVIDLMQNFDLSEKSGK